MTSPWRLQLRTGSFRGVLFKIDSHDFEGGRRIVDHLFPYKDEAFTEDLGRKQRIFKLNIYVIGADYFPEREALQEAFEKGGPGILVHPYLGNKTVEAADFTLSESQAEGGFAKFSVTFRETSRLVNPSGVVDAVSSAKDKANAVQLALARAFAVFNTPSPTAFVLDSAAALVNTAADVLSSATNALPTGSLNSIANLSYSIRNLKGSSRALISRPDQLSKAISRAVTGLTSVLNIDGLLPEDASGRVIYGQLGRVSEDEAKRKSFLPILAFPDLIPATILTTDSRRLEASNSKLMTQLLIGSALGELLIVSVSTSYGTFEDAVDQRDLIVSEIDKLLGDPSLSDDVYSALQDLAASAVESIPDPASESPRLSKLKLSGVVSSLTIGYELYGNLSLESDIIVRNKIKHPGFILPTKPLEVIAGD